MVKYKYMSKIIIDKDRVEEVLTRGVEELISRDSLDKKLKSGKKLRIKLGIDPTSPNIHIGRSIPILKLRDFQKLGHQVVLIVGDFTGVIGDTSDKESERPMLSKETIKKNMKGYIRQAGKIIDLSKCEFYYNSKWLGKLKYEEIGEQADSFSLSDFISRDNIKKRLNAGNRVSLREVLYPLMQGYDSVAIKADIEIGGMDQKFNLLAGRKLQERFKQIPQDIIMNPLILGTDGRKMSSSWGNVINLKDEPSNMYGKVMSLDDNLIIQYFKLTTRVSMDEINKYEDKLKNGGNPKNIKMQLAKELVTMYHSKRKAKEAQENWEKTFSKKEIPDGVLEIKVNEKELLVDILLKNKIVSSKSDFRRLIDENAITNLDTNEKIKDYNLSVKSGTYRIGKKRFCKINVL